MLGVIIFQEEQCSFGYTGVASRMILPAFASATLYNVTNTAASASAPYDLVLTLDTRGYTCARAVRAVSVDFDGTNPLDVSSLPVWVDTADCTTSGATGVWVAVGSIPAGATIQVRNPVMDGGVCWCVGVMSVCARGTITIRYTCPY